MQCKYCGSIHVEQRGIKRKKNSFQKQSQCQECGKWNFEGAISNRTAKILVLDIETAQMEFRGFSPRTDYIPFDDVMKDYCILCWSAKWLFDSKIVGESLNPKEAFNRKDKRILIGMWKLLDEADIVVVQNGRKFDIPKLNFRFLVAGYKPPMRYLVVDTLEVLRNKFGSSYNALEYVNHVLGIDGKSPMVKQDWADCISNSDRAIPALNKMLKYNKKDVFILEELYLKLLPWITAHPNLGLYADYSKDVCPNCESLNLKWGGNYMTPTGVYKSFRCGDCGAVGRRTQKKNRIRKVDITS